MAQKTNSEKMQKAVESQGDRALDAKQFELAKAFYKRVFDFNSDNMKIRLKLARATLFAKDPEDALLCVQPAIGNNAEIPQDFAHDVLWTLILCGRYSALANVLGRFQKQYPRDAFRVDNFEYLLPCYASACSYYADGNWIEAIDSFSRIYYFNADCPDVLALLSDCYFEIDDRRRALRWASKVLEQKRRHPLAKCIMELCNMVERREEGCDVMLPQPSLPDVSAEIHILLISQAFLRRSEQLRKGLNRWKGLEHFRNEKYHEAIESLTIAIDNAGDKKRIVDCIGLRARAHFHLFQFPQAETDLNLVLSNSSELDPELLKLQIQLLIRKGDVEMIQRISLNYPENEECIYFLEKVKEAKRLYRVKSYDCAEFLLTVIIYPSVYFKNDKLVGMLAMCSIKSGKYARAREFAKHAVKLNSNNFDGQLAISMLLIHDGRFKEALFQLQKNVFPLNPHDEEVKQLIKKLKITSGGKRPTSPPPPPQEKCFSPPEKTAPRSARTFSSTLTAPKITIDGSRNYYDVLGVSPSTHPIVLKKKIAMLMKVYHPDKGHVKEGKYFTYLKEMRRILVENPEERKKYDAALHL